jgi:hypothetical protein
MTKRLIRELGLGIAGLVYLILVFFRNIYSPVIAVVLVSLAAYVLIDSHRAGNGH